MQSFKKYILLILALIVPACVSEFREPVMPEWDVSLTLPIVTDYTLGELIDKIDDSKLYYDPQRDSEIIYKTSLAINPISINNPEYIELTSGGSVGKIAISDFNFALKEDLKFDTKINDFLPNFPLNIPMAISPFMGINYNKDISLSSLNYVSIAHSNVRIEINNSLPIDVTINQLTLQNNPSPGSLIITKNNISIPKNSALTLNEPINNKDIFNSLKLNVTVSSSGSNELPVTISQSNGITITFIPENIKINSAEASFDEQTYTFSIEKQLSNYENNIDIKSAKIKNGKLSVSLRNYSAIGGKLKSQVRQLKNGSYIFTTGDLSVPAKNTISKNYFLPGYDLEPENRSVIKFDNTVVLNSTNGAFVKISAGDSILYSIELTGLELESFNGSISGDIKQSFNLPKEDIEKYFNGNLLLKEVFASLFVNNGSGLPFKMNNNLVSGYNKITKKTEYMTINNVNVNPNGKTEVPLNTNDFTAFINKFTTTNSLPDAFNFSTKINLTTNGENYYFSGRDTISGYVDLRIPLHLSVSNLSYKDSVDVDFSESDKEQIKNLNFGKLTIKAKNGIPAEGVLRVSFFDQNNKRLNFPKNSTTGYKIASSGKDISGYATNIVESIITEEISKDDINFLINSTKCVFDVLLNTNQGEASFLKREDKIKLNIISEFGYRVKSE